MCSKSVEGVDEPQYTGSSSDEELRSASAKIRTDASLSHVPTMATQHDSVLKAILQYVPEASRSKAIKDAIDAASKFEGCDIASTVPLLAELADDAKARQVLLSRLSRLMERGHVDAVLKTCAQDQALEHEVLLLAVSRLCAVVGKMQRHDSLDLASVMDHIPVLDKQGRPKESPAELCGYATSILQFLKAKGTFKFEETAQVSIVNALAWLLGVADHAMAFAARDALSVFLNSTSLVSSMRVYPVWNGVDKLITCEDDPIRVDLGFSVWLRLVVAIDGFVMYLYTDQWYWTLLQRGLRFGDGERRKQCLVILRKSAAMAESSTTIRGRICAKIPAGTLSEVLTLRKEANSPAYHPSGHVALSSNCDPAINFRR